MLVSDTRHSVFTGTVDGTITMSQSEWQQFVAATSAPYKPRSILEFNAMCDLAAARYLHENVEGMGGMNAVAVEAMKFGPNGEINFPLTSAQDEYMKKHGTFPSAEQLKEFLRESGAPGAVVTPLRAVRGGGA